MQDIAVESLPSERTCEVVVPSVFFYSLCPSPDEKFATKKWQASEKTFFEEVSIETCRKFQCNSPEYCRICLMSTLEELICPCQCKGSVKYVHQSCLRAWVLQVFEKNGQFEVCEICKANYDVKFRYTFKLDLNWYQVLPLIIIFTVLICLLTFTLYWDSQGSQNEPFLYVLEGLCCLIGTVFLSTLGYLIKFEWLKKVLVNVDKKNNDEKSIQS